MFDIEYKGGNSLVIATKKATLLIDPKLSVVGGNDLDVSGQIELATESRFALSKVSARLNLEGPGEYEVADFSIKGIPATRHIDDDKTPQLATIYRIEIGEVRIALLGNVAPKLTDEQLEAIGVVDIVIIPVGGGGLTLDATSASHIVRQIDPKAVIPIHYADSALKYEMPQDSLETFTKELGAPVDEAVVKYKVKNATTLPVVLTVIELKRS